MNERVLPYAALMLFGIGWGASIPLSKIAVSGGHMPLGLIFWQFVIGVVLLGAFIAARGSLSEASSNQSAVDIVLLTDDVVEGTMNAALARLQRLDIVAAAIVRLRVAPTL